MALNHHDTLVAVHAFIACLAVLFIIPLALLVARFKRHKPRWVRVHAVLNIWGGIFIVIAFGLGLASVMLNPPEAPPDKNDVTEETTDPDSSSGRRRRRRRVLTVLTRILRRYVMQRHGDGDDDADADNSGDDSQFIGPEATFHHKMGLVLFILICMQIAWGFTTHYLAHSQERKKRKKRTHSSTIGDDGRSITPVSSDDEEDNDENPPRNGRNRTKPPPKRHWTQYTHMIFGIALLILFYIQCWNGLHTEWPAMSEKGDPVPTAILVLFWILVAAPIGPYCLHAISVFMHKGRTPLKSGDNSKGGAASGISERNENVRMTERIVVGGPSSTAAVRDQQQHHDHQDSEQTSHVPAYPTYVNEDVPLNSGPSQGPRFVPDRNFSRGSI